MKPLKTKKTSKFKQKIKNFFKIPEEVFEEEPSPQFARQKLFTLTRTNIFIGLFLFLLIINALIIFNVNFIYLRQILGFLFLVGVPGLVLMLCFKIRNTGFWEYLVYTIGLSISFIMFAGLIVNWTLPWIGITDKPLSLYPILICFDIFLIVLGIVAYKRNQDFKPKAFSVPKLDRLNNIMFTIPIIFPILSILGAFLLNNHGPNFLTMIMLGGIAVYVLLLTIYRKKLDKNIWPWALWMIGLSLLLMYSMRSWYVFGYDLSSEYNIFNITYKTLFWKMSNFNDAYNSCLSLSILPVILENYTQILPPYLFKFFFQILFSIFPILIFLFLKVNMQKIISFLCSVFIISFAWFIEPLIYITRQEIAFIFFGLMIIIMTTDKIRLNLRKLFFILFGISMVVSHYSTSYVSIFLLILIYFFILFYKYYKVIKTKREKKNFVTKSKVNLTWILILSVILFGFLWYSQVTSVSTGILSFSKKV